MTQPADETPTQAQIIARHSEAIETLTTTVELMQRQLHDLRLRVQALEGAPWPDQEPSDPG